jgi:hypothetical protein
VTDKDEKPKDEKPKDEKPMVLYTAVYDSVPAALDGLDAVEQLHKDKMIGTFDAAVIDKKNGEPHIAKRMDRPAARIIPEVFGGGTLPRKELLDAAGELMSGQAGLIVVGELTVEQGLDLALSREAKLVKRTLDATIDEITSELQDALRG